jgi:hypothetical protein
LQQQDKRNLLNWYSFALQFQGGTRQKNCTGNQNFFFFFFFFSVMSSTCSSEVAARLDGLMDSMMDLDTGLGAPSARRAGGG